MEAPIDLWNVETYDPGLLSFLGEHEVLIRSYHAAENHIFINYDCGQGRSGIQLRPNNPHAGPYLRLKEEMGEWLKVRTVRGYHHTRLTDQEVVAMRRDGIHLSTLDSFRRRLEAAVDAGHISSGDLEKLYDSSPFVQGQLKIRENMFWLSSYPIEPDDTGVAGLLEHWGGESTYFWQRDVVLTARLQAIGKPRIVEVAVPLASTKNASGAGVMVLTVYAKFLGVHASKAAIDICVRAPLPPEAILAVHTKGEPNFTNMAKGYPETFLGMEPIGLEGWP